MKRSAAGFSRRIAISFPPRKVGFSSTPPKVSIGLNPASGTAPLNVDFTANVSLTAGFITSYKWIFGDSLTSADPSPSHLYQNPGSYNVKLTVSDNLGNIVSAIALVGVSGNSSFGDTFSGGVLDQSKWLASDEPATAIISRPSSVCPIE